MKSLESMVFFACLALTTSVAGATRCWIQFSPEAPGFGLRLPPQACRARGPVELPAACLGSGLALRPGADVLTLPELWLLGLQIGMVVLSDGCDNV